MISSLSENDIRYCEAIEKALRDGEKHNKHSIEKIAAGFGIHNKNVVKELTELAIVRIAREISSDQTADLHTKFQEIVELYSNQVNLSHRTSQSMLLQQYSTPAPIAYLAGLYVLNGLPDKKLFFEPSAGNGLLTVALPRFQTYVNEIDDVRSANLKTQGFAWQTNQDATIPFSDYYRHFDGIITNPPFGTLMEPVDYDGFPIKTLDHLMALRALDCMKDDGRAAIIIGGHTTWDEQGRIQAGKNRLFFNYLYSHYHVDDVILIDGHKLYSRQGTSFDVRLILISGRKDIVRGFAPLLDNSTSYLSEVVTDFDTLWGRVFGNKSKQPDYTTLNVKLKLKAKSLELIFKSLDGNIQTEVLSVKDLYKEKVNEVVIKKFYQSNLNGKTVLNLDKQVMIIFKSIGLNKTIFGRKDKKGKTIRIDSIIATAIHYLDHLLEYGVFESYGYKLKPNHIKMKGVKFWNFRSKLIIDNRLYNFIIPVLETKNCKLQYSIEYAKIKKSLVALRARP